MMVKILTIKGKGFSNLLLIWVLQLLECSHLNLIAVLIVKDQINDKILKLPIGGVMKAVLIVKEQMNNRVVVKEQMNNRVVVYKVLQLPKCSPSNWIAKVHHKRILQNKATEIPNPPICRNKIYLGSVHLNSE